MTAGKPCRPASERRDVARVALIAVLAGAALATAAIELFRRDL
jgi:hypothetical protein